MKKGLVGLAAGVFVLLSCSVMAAQVEVSGSLGITGTAGIDGVVFPDSTLQTSAVIGSEYQKRITASCSAGYAIRAIDVTGGVATCQATGVTGTLGTDQGGTGITSAPSAAGQYLRSTGSKSWGVGTISFTDLPSLSSGYVDLGTNQTVGGNKTFAGQITAAAGLTFGDGTTQTTAAVPPVPAAIAPGKTRLTTLDNLGLTGQYTSITIGTDGLPVISHYDNSASRLIVAKCGDASCSTACGSGGTVCKIPDNTLDAGLYTSIAIGTDGLPVISYYDSSATSLKVAKCGDASCSTACGSGGTVCTTVDNTASVGPYTSITIGTDGFPVISYFDVSSPSLKVAKCNNIYCTSNWSRR